MRLSRWHFNFLLIIAVGVFFRVLWLGNTPGISGDEAYTATLVRAWLKLGEPINWIVPTERLLSPIYVGLVALCEWLFPVSFITLRLPAVIGGLLTMVLVGALMTRAFGRTVGTLSLLLVAAFPMSIAYSRSAVEQCLVGAAAVPPIYFAVKGRWAPTLFAYLIAVLIHPVNLFLGAIIVPPLYVASEKKKFLLIGMGMAVAAAVVIQFWFIPPAYTKAVLKNFIHQATHPLELIAYLHHYIRLVTGVSAFAYFSGKPPWIWAEASQIILGVAFYALVFLGVRQLIQNKDRIALSLILGWGISLLGYYLFAGTSAMSATFSRYAIFFIVPSAICISILIGALARDWQERTLWGSSAVCWGLLASFWIFYFAQIHKTGGGGVHFGTYQTNAIEPKQAIFEWISREPTASKPLVLTDDWFYYWPIRYLNLEKQAMDVRMLNEIDKRTSRWNEHSYDLSQTSPEIFWREMEKGAYAVGAPDSTISKLIEKHPPPTGFALDAKVSSDYGKRPVLTVWRLISTSTSLKAD